MASSDLADFKARLGLDSAPLDAGFSQAQAKAGQLDRAFAKVGNSFGNQFVKFFTAGFLVSATARTVKSVSEMASGARNIAKEFGLTTTEAQLLDQLSNKTGKSISEMAKSAESLAENLKEAKSQGFVTLNSDTVATLNEFTDKAAKGKRGFGVGAAAVGAELLENPLNVVSAFTETLFGVTSGLKEIIKRRTTPDQGDSNAVEQRRLNAEQAAFAELAAKRIEALDKERAKMEERRGKLFESEENVRKAGLSTEQRRAEIENDLSLFRANLKDVDPNSPGGINIRENIAKLEMERLGLPVEKPNSVFGIQPDSLTSVGNFLGQDPTRGLGQSIDYLRSIDRRLANLERNRSIERSTPASFP